MAKRRPRAARSESPAPAEGELGPLDGPELFGPEYSGLDSDASARGGVETTGRKIVTILSDDPADRQRVIDYFAARDVDEVVRSADFEEGAVDLEQAAEADAVVLDELPIIILNENPNVARAVVSRSASLEEEDVRRLFVVEEDRRLFPICPDGGFAGAESGGVLDMPVAAGGWGSDGGAPLPLPLPMPLPMPLPGGLSAYHQGYLAGVNWLSANLLGTGAVSVAVPSLSPAADLAPAAGRCYQDASATWGLQATRVESSNLTGRGIRVAILDTGFEFGHPDRDFASRVVARNSFVGGSAQDDNGHGTHVTGTACGPRSPGGGIRRYGIAGEAEILVGKVLGLSGGSDSSVLSGINWAIGQGCQVINMSLGPRACRVQPPFAISHEQAAKIALQRGTLIIAAAGNNSRRSSGQICPVVGPAAAPSIVAVAAVDSCGRVADFSNRGLDQAGGGEVNFAAPGVAVYSAWINPTRHKTISGTSMASPHVAGIAALIAQETGLRGLPLYRAVRQRVLNIGGDRRDVGNGFVRV